MDKHKAKFQDKYFTDYYMAMTGEFTPNDLQRNKNWFFGWFNSLMEIYNFRQGFGKEVLEIGCAIGAAADLLSERGFKVTATDLSELAVKKASRLSPHIQFEQLDIELTKKYSNKFDLVYSFEVIEHLEQHERAIENMFRMLKPGGVVLASTPFPYGYVYFDKTHVNVRHPKDWQRIFKKVGFVNVQTKQVGFIPFFYRFSQYFHISFPFGINSSYVNSPVFIYAQKPIK